MKEAGLAKDEDKKTPDEQPDRQEEVFMREVDEAVREDDLRNFAQKYGVWIVPQRGPPYRVQKQSPANRTSGPEL